MKLINKFHSKGNEQEIHAVLITLIMNGKESEGRMSVSLTMNRSANPLAALVKLPYPAIYKFTCNMGLRWFPFDHQLCRMMFMSQSFDSSAITYKLLHENLSLSKYEAHPQWTLVSSTITTDMSYRRWNSELYSTIAIELLLQRKPTYYVFNFLFPCVVVTLVSIIGFFSEENILGQKRQKVYMGINALLGMSVLLLSLSSHIPSTSSYIPLLGE
ncbi:unnamed protein product [Soboliphyme baturini]|uniref:Neur_chan_LBD domain-containing protein n=1 Tax=Soboliphyme baturini TaxID=241478 RepID=A0A183IBU8_9BILA|nr:unnamed protein product [Soboliphyme baturini]